MPDGTVRAFDGTKWVAGAYGQSGFVPLSGGTMSGPLVLSGNPAVALGAATKQYADTYANNDGRNLIHNALFNVAQRGAGPWTVSTYTADRWQTGLSLDTISFSVVGLGPTDVSQIGDEAAQLSLQNVFTGNAGASAWNGAWQRIENVARLGNKTVTVSFWAKAASGTPKLGVSCDQNFGSGGSPAAPVSGNGQAVTLATTWTRYSLTFTLPATSGKAFGTNADHFTEVNFWYSAGSSMATRAGNIGVQSGTIWLWGVQLEIGSVATPLEKVEYADDLRHCMRFFETSFSATPGAWGYNNGEGIGGAHPTAQFRYYAPFRVTKRGSPTITTYDRNGSVGYCSWYGSALNDGGTLNFAAASQKGFYAGHNIATSIETQFGWTASADL
jgi:Carbohydrate binding domain